MRLTGAQIEKGRNKGRRKIGKKTWDMDGSEEPSLEPFKTTGLTAYKVAIRLKLSSRLDPGGIHPLEDSTNCRQLKFSSSEAHARILPSCLAGAVSPPRRDQFLRPIKL